jgi:hypothetical protein
LWTTWFILVSATLLNSVPPKVLLIPFLSFHYLYENFHQHIWFNSNFCGSDSHICRLEPLAQFCIYVCKVLLYIFWMSWLQARREKPWADFSSCFATGLLLSDSAKYYFPCENLKDRNFQTTLLCVNELSCIIWVHLLSFKFVFCFTSQELVQTSINVFSHVLLWYAADWSFLYVTLQKIVRKMSHCITYTFYDYKLNMIIIES